MSLHSTTNEPLPTNLFDIPMSTDTGRRIIGQPEKLSVGYSHGNMRSIHISQLATPIDGAHRPHKNRFALSYRAGFPESTRKG
jgi:hypothetical protein